MTTKSKHNRVSTEERFKKAVPFKWGYGSTPRTSMLRNALYWKGAVTESILVKPAEGLGKTGFRKGIRIDMDRRGSSPRPFGKPMASRLHYSIPAWWKSYARRCPSSSRTGI